MLRVIRDSGWNGPIGIIDHREETDSEETLRENLQGLDKLVDTTSRIPKSSRAGRSDAHVRLPLYEVEPAALALERTPANGFPRPDVFMDWQRSHGDASSARFSGLRQIIVANVKALQAAWTYHAGDGSGNIQCNPIVVDGLHVHADSWRRHRRCGCSDREGGLAL